MKYFTINELTFSQAAKRLKIDNTPPAYAKANLVALVDNILDPLREAWGKPVIVTSGYRSPSLNAAVGGAKTSQHTKGQAADIRSLSDSPEDNMALLRCLLKLNLPFDQIISEYPDSQGRPNWIHVSFSPKHRRQMLTCKAGKYYAGIKYK